MSSVAYARCPIDRREREGLAAPVVRELDLGRAGRGRHEHQRELARSPTPSASSPSAQSLEKVPRCVEVVLQGGSGEHLFRNVKTPPSFSSELYVSDSSIEILIDTHRDDGLQEGEVTVRAGEAPAGACGEGVLGGSEDDDARRGGRRSR